MTSRAGQIAAELRRQARLTAASQAKEIRLIAQLTGEVEAAVRAELAAGPRVSGQPDDEEVLFDAMLAEVQGTLGVGAWWAARLVEAATRLTTVHTATLSAVEAGQLDLTRARQLAAATDSLPNKAAQLVEAQVLSRAGTAPWAGPTPRAWRDGLARAVVRVAPGAAREQRRHAIEARSLTTWLAGNGTGELCVTAADLDIQMAEEVICGLAKEWPAVDPANPDGDKLSTDQRRVDAFMDLLRRVRDGAELPHLSVRREHDVGLVMPADTLFSDADPTPPPDGPDDGPFLAPGELRGSGRPVYLDPVTAAELARREIARGAATTVLLTDPVGALVGQVRLPAPTVGSWTPATLLAAIRARLDRAQPPTTDRYSPTRAQASFVRTRNPRCTAYDCSRVARSCDLDHDVPWPRGPTDVSNLAPRCRRHHEQKTRRLLRTKLRPDGTVLTTTLTGLTMTTRPEPLPGYDLAEQRPGRLDGTATDESAA